MNVFLFGSHKISSSLHLRFTCNHFRINLSSTLFSKHIINPYTKVNMPHTSLIHISVHILHTCQRFLIISHQLCLSIWLVCNLSLEAMLEGACMYWWVFSFLCPFFLLCQWCNFGYSFFYSIHWICFKTWIHISQKKKTVISDTFTLLKLKTLQNAWILLTRKEKKPYKYLQCLLLHV